MIGEPLAKIMKLMPAQNKEDCIKALILRRRLQVWVHSMIYYRIYRASGNGWMSVTIYSSEIEDRAVFDVDRAVEVLTGRGYTVNLSKDSQGWVLEIDWDDCYE